MFDSSTFLYAEEKILAERMKAIGKGIYYDPSVRSEERRVGKEC